MELLVGYLVRAPANASANKGTTFDGEADTTVMEP